VIRPARLAHPALTLSRFARFARFARLSPPLALLSLLTAPVGCKVSASAFQSRVFKCDTAAPDPLCGTDAAGDPMTCFAARQIGGADFCTEKCTEPMSLPDENAVCVQGGAKLKACDPDDDANTDGRHPLGACDRLDLGCLRTDVATPAGEPGEGVCITGNPCSQDDDCRDPVRSKCAATFLKELYTGTHDLKSDHLYCLQEGCVSGNTACSPGETCLPKVIPAAGNPPDICVPNCDSKGHCPPNHFCLATISGKANPAVCIPGLLSFVCQTDVDCLVGKCQSDDDPDPVHGLKLCTLACQSDDDCAKYDSVQGRFVCSKGQNPHCITPDAYTGALCRTTDDCSRDMETICARQSPTDQQGTCLRPCDDKRMCTARGGIGHTCLPLVGDDAMEALVCLPGFFPFPCFDDSQCAVPDLACAGVDLTDPKNPVPGHCTKLCASDAVCEKNKWTAGQSYCGAPTVPICLPLGQDGDECEADKQCASKTCAVPPGTGTAKTCGGKLK
jgi:hypothetical protein